jgi:hypothetical protein
MRLNVRLKTILLLLISLVLLSACSPGALPTSQPEAPAAEEPAAEVITTAVVVEKEVVEPQPTQSIQPTLSPQEAPSQVVVEARLVELEWPSRLRLGDSDIVRLSLIPSEEGYAVQADFPEHDTELQPVQVPRPPGYELYGVARLDGVGFDIAPQGEQAQYLPPGEAVTWQWSLTPRAAGQQRLSVLLMLRWAPQAGVVGASRESAVYNRSLDVQVASFFGLTRGQAMTGGLLGLLFGTGLSLVGLVGMFKPGRTPPAAQPNLRLQLEPRPGLVLRPAEASLLRTLFQRYARLVLESEFLSGYSGARTFLVKPIRPDGRADAATIVKVGLIPSVRREFENYEQFVKDSLPPITARIQHPPVTVRGADLAAIQYTFIGAPGHTPHSLRLALLADPDPAYLHKLFETFGPNWWMQRKPYTFRLAAEYDRVLPTHLVVEPAAGRGHPVDGSQSPAEVDLRVGDMVTLRSFPQVERRLDGRSLSLQGTAQPGHPPLRVRWLGLANPQGATGRVVATRHSLLVDSVSDLERLGLPDPIPRLPDLLAQTVSGSQSTIHGDLNLENILVGPGGFVWLIDFAQTRDGHTLFDFAHLGAELIAHVVAAHIDSPQAYFDLLLSDPFGEGEPANGSDASSSLLRALTQIASKCLFNPAEPQEFHLALCLACLGALKYQNLDFSQKHLLYLTAAYLCARL